jgi:Cu+-exporting ATPase
MKGDITKIAEAISLRYKRTHNSHPNLRSKKTMGIIQQNLFWSFAYNIAAVPLAMFGILSPEIASFAMAMSSVSVVTNSLRLKNFMPKLPNKQP